MPDLLTLPLRAADLVTRPVRWAVGHALDRLRGDVPSPPEPEPKPEPQPRATAKPRPGPAKPKPKPAAKRPPARREPTRGQVAALREKQREAEQNAGGPGPGPTLEVAAPWDGYDTMTEDAILERLIGAEPALRAIVRLYEREHGGRRQILLATEAVEAQP